MHKSTRSCREKQWEILCTSLFVNDVIFAIIDQVMVMELTMWHQEYNNGCICNIIIYIHRATEDESICSYERHEVFWDGVYCLQLHVKTK